MQTVTEGSATIRTSTEKKISKELEVFYNPIMKLNRDLTILLLKHWPKDQLVIADILAGTGVRSIRLLKELPKKRIKAILANDLNPGHIEENLALNQITQDPRITVTHTDASKALLAMRPAHYIDIDPYGSPNPFLDAAIKRLAIGGILAVTATDTAALAGTYPKACRRKYWAEPMRNSLMHEVGLRILARKVQLEGAQFDRALTPILAYAEQHYYRILFKMQKSKTATDRMLGRHQYLLHCASCGKNAYSSNHDATCCDQPMRWAGPLFSGQLQELPLLARMQKDGEPATAALLEALQAEYAIDVPGFFDVHQLAKARGIKQIPRFDRLIDIMQKRGFAVARAHTNRYALKTDMPVGAFLELLEKK